MIVTVTLNASLDKTYSVPGFGVGRDAAAARVEYSPGGKGLNVASFARTLGARVLATGILAGHAGRHVRELLTSRGVDHDFVYAPGETRSCHIIHDPESDTLTQIREKGPVLAPEVRRQVSAKIRSLTAKSRLFVFSGSVPPGLGADVYRELIEMVRAAGVPAILDASGQPLAMGLQARPDLIKPNLQELDELASRCGWPGVSAPANASLTDEQRRSVDRFESLLSPSAEAVDQEAVRRAAAAAARSVQARFGVDVVASMGPLGAVVVEDNSVYCVVPPRIAAVNTVSCGDALVAGIAVGWTRGLHTRGAVRLGVATATAKALRFETGQVAPEAVSRMLPQVTTVPMHR